MINKKLVVATLVLIIGMPVMAEPAANPGQDSKAQGASHEWKRNSVPMKVENRKVEKTAKVVAGTTKAREAKTGGAALPK